ncbi:hypothetical protein T10_9955 [Trichinella papuae]|uniref:Uncharacterized protein n=1 Tax=Trichinella papuae TaxID=268474 RepID=A0A0V1MYK8_9BILA|nr:hypothetical protein T10_9955 [Trichinella papuae]
MHPIVASLEISMVIEQSNDIKNIAAVEIGSQRLKIHVFGCVMMHISLVVQYFQQLFSDFIMSATIKMIPDIADEAANTKKKTIILNFLNLCNTSTTAANALIQINEAKY